MAPFGLFDEWHLGLFDGQCPQWHLLAYLTPTQPSNSAQWHLLAYLTPTQPSNSAQWHLLAYLTPTQPNGTLAYLTPTQPSNSAQWHLGLFDSNSALQLSPMAPQAKAPHRPTFPPRWQQRLRLSTDTGTPGHWRSMPKVARWHSKLFDNA